MKAAASILAAMTLVLPAASGPLRVGVFVDRGARGIGCAKWIQIASCMEDAEAKMLDADRIRAGALGEIDVLVMPGGRSVQEAKSLGEDGREAVKSFIRGGGGYIGTCAGCCLVMQPCDHHPGMMGVIPYKFSGCGGSADLRIDFNKRAKELAGIKPGAYELHYEDGPVPVRTDVEIEGASFETVATYASDINLRSGRERKSFAGEAAAIAGTYGKGRVFVLSVHPECDAQDAAVIRGAFRYVSGRETAWKFPQRKHGRLAVGFSCADSPGVETAELLAALTKSGEFDIVPVGIDEIRSGALSHLDAVLAPDSLGSFEKAEAGLGGLNRKRTKKFLVRGGRVIAWGRGAKGMEEAGMDGVESVAGAKEALEALRRQPGRQTAGPSGHPAAEPSSNRIVKVAVYCGPGGANFDVAPYMRNTSNYAPSVVVAQEIRAGILSRFDMLLVPGGSSNAQMKDLGPEGVEEVRKFVRGGGFYYGICAGAFLAAQPRIGLAPFEDDHPEHYRGGAAILLAATKEGRGTFPGWKAERYAWYHGGPAFVPGAPVEDSDVKVLAKYYGCVINTESPKSVKPMNGKGAILGGRVGKGRMILCGPHPEQFEYSFDMVKDMLTWLTGVAPAERRETWRRPGAASVLLVTARNPAAAKFHMDVLSQDDRFDVRTKLRKIDPNVLPHVDAVVIVSPVKDYAKSAALKDFIAAGGTVIAVGDSEKRLEAAEKIEGARVVRDYGEAMKALLEVHAGRADFRHARGNLQVAVMCKGKSRQGKAMLRELRNLDGVDVTKLDEAAVARGRLQYYDVLVKPQDVTPGAYAKSEIELFEKSGGKVVRRRLVENAVKDVEKLRDAEWSSFAAGAAPARPKAAGALKAVVYRDNGVSDDGVARLLDLCPEIEIRYASGEEIAHGALQGADMVVHGGGSGEKQYDTLGPEGAAAEREFIRNGGLYHGTCAGAFLVLEPTRRRRSQLVAFKPDDPPTYRGGATVRLDFAEEGRAAFGEPHSRMVGYHGGPAMIPGSPVEGSDCAVFAYYGDEMKDIELPKSDIRSLAGKAAIVGGTFGKGRLLITGPHPEGDGATYDIFFKGVEWLAGRKLSPQRRWHRRGALRVGAVTGLRTPEGGRLARAVWNDKDVNRLPFSRNADVLLLIDPKKEDIEREAAFRGKKIVFALHPGSVAAVKAAGARLAGAQVFATAAEALAAIDALK